MMIRHSKVLLVAAIALFATLAAFGNITDYGTNFAFVQHVLRMDTVFPDATIRYRAIDQEWAHHAAYAFIILMEAATAALCWAGAWHMFRSRHASAAGFNRSKRIAIAGLTLGFLVWQVGFMSIGGEWFGMWMSPQWNGVPSAFRFFVTIGIVLIFVAQRDGEVADAP
jgi:predicted small integral membrane protein